MALTNDTRVPLNSVAAKWQPEAFARVSARARNAFPLDANAGLQAGDKRGGGARRLRARTRQDGPPLAVARASAEPTARPADARRGGELVTTLGCLSCHRLDKAPDQSHAPTLASLGAGNWAQGCVADDAAARGQAPDFSFDAAQRVALRAFAQDGFPDALHRDVAAEFAGRQYAALRCNACHPRDTETDLLTRLAAAATQAKTA